MKGVSSPVRIWLCIALIALLACDPSFDNVEEEKQAPFVLRVGFPPAENAEAILRKNEALMSYLQKQAGIKKIEFSVSPSYTATIEDLQNHKLDLVNVGSLTYVLAKNVSNIKPLVCALVNGRSDNNAWIIVRQDSDIHSISDLAGRRFAFGDVASTSGHLIPHQALLDAGIDPHKDFDTLIYTGAHDKTVFAVLRGKVDAGAINARLYPEMIKRGQFNDSDVRVIWKSQPFVDFPWAIRADLDSKLIDVIQHAFTSLDDKSLLNILGVDQYQPTTDADFNGVRQAAIKMGFMQKNEPR